MPNQRNIDAPITLVAPGRSGTSLISDLFVRHPDFCFVGETANLIFYAWQAVEASTGVIRPLFEGGSWISDDERAGRAVRQTFLTCFPSEHREWFHKPIGVPVALITKFKESQWSDAAEWYWKVMHQAFPKAKYFTILRHPCDVILSAQSYWGYDEATNWWALGFMSYLLAHPAARVEYAISYDHLVRDSEEVVRNLFSFLEIPFRKRILDAFSHMHAAAKGREALRPDMTTRKSEWNKLDPAKAKPLYLESITELFNKFGHSLELPEHFIEYNSSSETNLDSSPVLEANDQPNQEQEIAKLTKVIVDLNHQVSKMSLEHAKKQQETERELYTVRTTQRQRIDKLEGWIQASKQGRAWLAAQRADRESEAESTARSSAQIQQSSVQRIRNIRWRAERELWYQLRRARSYVRRLMRPQKEL